LTFRENSVSLRPDTSTFFQMMLQRVFFDIQGKQCILEAGVAGGEEKVAAILGALRGGYLNVLITDSVTAQKVLERHGSET
jgi:hypothetical protein